MCGGRGFGDFDARRIFQELINQTGDFRRHGRREEQRLTPRRQQFADLFDIRDKAHVEHAVGFVDHQDLDAHQHDAATAEMIQQPTGGGDQHIDAAIKFSHLIIHRDAADQQRHVELVIDAVFLEALCDLCRQFTCRREDQRARHASTGAATFEAGNHWQDKRGGFAGAGLGNAEHVAAGHRDRNGLGLDRCWGGVPGGR